MNDTASLFNTEALLSDGIKSTPPSSFAASSKQHPTRT